MTEIISVRINFMNCNWLILVLVAMMTVRMNLKGYFLHICFVYAKPSCSNAKPSQGIQG